MSKFSPFLAVGTVNSHVDGHGRIFNRLSLLNHPEPCERSAMQSSVCNIFIFVYVTVYKRSTQVAGIYVSDCSARLYVNRAELTIAPLVPDSPKRFLSFRW